jgi:hypothetical protein
MCFSLCLRALCLGASGSDPCADDARICIFSGYLRPVREGA